MLIKYSVAKDLNGLGRPIKRIKNRLGERGIKKPWITKAVRSTFLFCVKKA